MPELAFIQERSMFNSQKVALAQDSLVAKSENVANSSHMTFRCLNDRGSQMQTFEEKSQFDQLLAVKPPLILDHQCPFVP
jgi:hypothetical protein